MVLVHLPEVADSLKYGFCWSFVESFADVGVAQVDPTNDAGHEVSIFGDFKAPSCLFDRRVGLDDDGFIDAGLGDEGAQLIWAVIDRIGLPSGIQS